MKSRHGLAFLGAVFRTGSTDPILMPRPLRHRQDDFPPNQSFYFTAFFHFFKQVSPALITKTKMASTKLPLLRRPGRRSGVFIFRQLQKEKMFSEIVSLLMLGKTACMVACPTLLFCLSWRQRGPRGGKFKRGLRKISLKIIAQPFNIICNRFLR